MKSWTIAEVKTELRRLEAKRSSAPRPDVIQIDRTLARLRAQLAKRMQ